MSRIIEADECECLNCYEFSPSCPPRKELPKKVNVHQNYSKSLMSVNLFSWPIILSAKMDVLHLKIDRKIISRAELHDIFFLL